MSLRIHIQLPYPEAETHTAVWSEEEKQIDFRHEPGRADRCTVAFAAMELRRHLERTIPNASIVSCAHAPRHAFRICLRLRPSAGRQGKFVLKPLRNGVAIEGAGRAGLLYGAYEFLRLQGWQWLAPGKAGEVVPPPRTRLALPLRPQPHRPSLPLGRGFDFEGVSKESAELLLWMARNRMNVCGYRPATASLARKLGMDLQIGGHIFEAILDPNRIMPSGGTLFDAHPEWYGLPTNGPRDRTRALQIQFCVSQTGLVEFLGQELLTFLTGEWQGADRINIWGFDTWGNTCACSSCRARGNSTDQYLFFISRLRACLDRARQAGRLDHAVRLVLCAYEGTCTMAPPGRPVPRNLGRAGDYVVVYPINRCYGHDLVDSDCGVNRFYRRMLLGWTRKSRSLPVVVGEYYNVSKFEDLPLLFTTRLRHDLPAYGRSGVKGITYMHVPLVNWAMRTLTQSLYAQLAWNIDTDVDAFLKDYFATWYGPHAGSMRVAYAHIERAGRWIAEWRAWASRSVLSQLQRWDGRPSAQPLAMDNHFRTVPRAIANGRKASWQLAAALRIAERAQARDRQHRSCRTTKDLNVAVNPVELQRREASHRYEMRLGEDRRLLLYGLHTMMLTTELIAYHDSLRRKAGKTARLSWGRIEEIAAKMDAYYVPLQYEWPGPGLESHDALTRSQLRDVVRRCRQWRGGGKGESGKGGGRR